MIVTEEDKDKINGVKIFDDLLELYAAGLRAEGQQISWSESEGVTSVSITITWISEDPQRVYVITPKDREEIMEAWTKRSQELISGKNAEYVDSLSDFVFDFMFDALYILRVNKRG
jgi:hypothetical protein